MDVLAKHLKVGQVMIIEYGREDNFVNFTVSDVSAGDITVVHATSNIGNECFAFSNNETIKIVGNMEGK